MAGCCKGITCECMITEGVNIGVTGSGGADDPFVISSTIDLSGYDTIEAREAAINLIMTTLYVDVTAALTLQLPDALAAELALQLPGAITEIDLVSAADLEVVTDGIAAAAAVDDAPASTPTGTTTWTWTSESWRVKKHGRFVDLHFSGVVASFLGTLRLGLPIGFEAISYAAGRQAVGTWWAEDVGTAYLSGVAVICTDAAVEFYVTNSAFPVTTSNPWNVSVAVGDPFSCCIRYEALDA